MNGGESHGINDGGGKKPEGQEIGQDILNIPKMDSQRGDEKSESQRKDELDNDDQREIEQVGSKRFAENGHKEEKDRQSEHKMNQIRADRDDGKNLSWKQDFLYQIPMNHQHVGRLKR